MKKPSGLNIKKMSQVGVIAISSLLASCGGGGDEKTSTPPVSTTPTQPGTGGGTAPGTGGGTTPGTGGGNTPTNPTYLYGYAQGYGNLSQSSVVLSYNGTILYTSQTDSNGKYQIDKTKFEQALKDYKIPATGMLEVQIQSGRDTKEQKDLVGTLSGLIPQDKISGSYVTVVADIVKAILEGEVKSTLLSTDGGYDKQKVRAKVQLILDTIGFTDVNNDTKKDVDDLFGYNISSFGSNLEDMISASPDRDYLFSSDTSKRQKLLEKLFQENNFISLQKQEKTVYLVPFFEKSSIEYSFNNVDWYTYTSSGVMINGTEKQLYYKELYSGGESSKMGNTILNPNGVDPEPIGTPEDTPEPEPIIEEKPDINDYTPVFPDVAKYEKDISVLDADITKVKLAIEELKKQYDTLTTEQKAQLTQLENQLQYLINLFNSLQKLPQDMVRGDLTVDTKRTLLDQEFVTNTTNAQIGALSAAPIQAFTADKTTIDNLKPKEGEQVSNEKIQKLQNIVDALARIMEAKKVAYDAKYQEYLKLKAEYDEDQRLYKFHQAEYEKYKAQYDGYKNTVSNAGTISPIGLNVGVILNNQGLDKTITTITAKKSEYIAPGASNYSLDTTSNSRSHTGVYPMEPGYNLFGTSYKVYIKFGVSGNKKDFPADVYIKNNTNGRESDMIEVKNLTHARDLREYLEKLMTIEVIVAYLEDMKEVEVKKDDADFLRFFYGLLKEVSQDMYKAEYEAYLAEKAKYDNTKILHDGYNNRLQTLLGDIRKVDSEFERKKGIEEYLGNLGVTIGNVAKEADNKQKEVILLGGKKDELSAEFLRNQQASLDKMLGKYRPSKSFPLDTSSQSKQPFQITQYIDSVNYPTFPLKSNVQYNTKGNNKDYPALVWVSYKPSTTYENEIKTESIWVNNEEQKEEVKKFLKQKAAERISAMQFVQYQDDFGEKIFGMGKDMVEKGWWWGDGRISLDQSEKEAFFEYVAYYQFHYLMKHDPLFQRQFQETLSEFTKIENIGGSDKKSIQKGLEEGAIKATRDFLLQYYDLVKSLSNLGWDDIKKGMKSIWGVVKDPAKTVGSIIDELKKFKEYIQKAYNLIRGLQGYHLAYGSSYAGTSVSLNLADPGKKLQAVVGNVKLAENAEGMKKFIEALNQAYKARIIKLYKDVKGVDDIIEISNKHHIKIGNGGQVITTYGDMKNAEAIIGILVQKGWKKTSANSNVVRYDSNDGKEAINVRTVSSSGTEFKEQGFTVNVTLDMMKKNGNTYDLIEEIKFLTPNE